MFKHAFHGGPAVEIFTITGKNPLQNWKTSGSLTKSFDSQMKGFIYTLEGQAKMQLPKEEKEFLGLIQPFLVFQIFIPLGKNLHIEVGITDSQKTKRRLIFHTGAKDIIANPLHARIPVTSFRRNQWLNLSLDIYAFAHHCFKGVNVRSIDLIVITSSCKIRKIFSMKNPLIDDDQEEIEPFLLELVQEEQREFLPQDQIPKNLGYPQGFIHFNQFIFPQRLKHKQTLDENINNTNLSQDQQQLALEQKPKVQLAFGQRIPKQQQQQLKQQISHLPKSSNKKQPNQMQESEGFYSPLASENNKNIKIDENIENQQDGYQDEDQIEDDKNLDNSSDQKRQKRITKEELKEEPHFLYFQTNSDEEDTNNVISTQKKVIDKQPPQANPWDKMGRRDHDLLIQGKKEAQKQNSKQASPHRIIQSKNLKQQRQSSKKKLQNLEDSEEETKFYSPISSAAIQQQDVNPTHRLDSDMSDDIILRYNKVQELQNKVSTIEQKYAKDQSQSPDLDPIRQRKTNGFKKPVRDAKVNLKQKDDKEDQFKKQSNYGNFNLGQWDTNQQDLSNDIEEAFDLNHENLLNFAQGNQSSQNLEIDVIQKRADSKDLKENPMYIEFELNNDDEDEYGQMNNQTKPANVFSYQTNLTTDLQQFETNQSYAKLESSRKEERRPFSPPFKMQADNQFQKKIEFLKVQRTEILRDSLDNSIPLATDKNVSLPQKAQVENEDGELLDVVFDPILKCYYDPKSNSYYELKDQL